VEAADVRAPLLCFRLLKKKTEEKIAFCGVLMSTPTGEYTYDTDESDVGRFFIFVILFPVLIVLLCIFKSFCEDEEGEESYKPVVVLSHQGGESSSTNGLNEEDSDDY
jgi:hypothetical protein